MKHNFKNQNWIATNEKSNENYKVETDETNLIYSVIPFGTNEPTKIIKIPISGMWINDYFIIISKGERHIIRINSNGDIEFAKLKNSCVGINTWSVNLRKV